MQPHKHERPVRQRNVDLACKRRFYKTIQKRCGVTAHHHSRSSRTEKRKQQQHVYNKLQNPYRGVFPFKKSRIKPVVQNLVQDSQHEHRNAQPFVGELLRDLKRHQKQERNSQRNVEHTLYNV